MTGDYPQPQNCSTDFFSQKKPIRMFLKSRKTLFKITIHPIASEAFPELELTKVRTD
jgi:hypothetical protein